MKRLLATILLLALLLATLISCGTPPATQSLPQTNNPTQETTEETPFSTAQTLPPETTELPPGTSPPPPSSTADTSFDEQWEAWEGYSSVPTFIVKLREEESPDGKHIFGSTSFCLSVLEDIPSMTNEKMKNFIEFNALAIWNHGAFIDYFCIEKEDYIEAVKKYDEFSYNLSYSDEMTFAQYCDDPGNERLYALWDIWYSENYSDHEWLLHPDFLAENQRLGRDRKDVFHRYEPDTVHTNYYYTIPWQFIEAVGADKFSEFEEDFAGTEKFNVLYFLEYFEIDEEEYLQLFPEKYKPHNPDYLYGTKEMQDKYFCRHPLGQ